MSQALCSQLAALPLGSCSLRSSSRAGFLQGSALPAGPSRPAQARAAVLSVEARYRGQGTDRTQVPQFRRHGNDCGSPEVQIAQLSARVLQLTAHLQAHRKDYASTRGLMQVLGRRKRLMQYLLAHDRSKYEELIAKLGIRPLKISAGSGREVKMTAEGATTVSGEALEAL